MSLVDEGRAVRAEEKLGAGAVDRWLKSQLPELRGEPKVTQFAGGASNWTYGLAYPERDLVLRRPPAGKKAKGAHDMAREHRVQSALRPVFPLVPEMVALCEDERVIGAPFYVMERIRGIILRKDPPPGLALTSRQARVLCEAFVDRLVDLHAIDPAAAGLSSLGKGPGYPRRQIEGWDRRYTDALTWNVPRWKRVRRWLAAHVPDDAGASVIHGDWRLDNLVLSQEDPTRIVGVLDWELATVGDPLMDLGSSLAYWVEASDPLALRILRRQPSNLPGMLTRDEILRRYADKSGRSIESFTFYEVYGLFRLAVIAQQIYYRYHHKQTQNPAFRWFWLFVGYLAWRADRILAERG